MEAIDVSRIIFSLTAVLCLIGLLTFFAKVAGKFPSGSILHRKRRLQVMETISLDGRRRLAIIKCDDNEHLLLLGPSNETVIAQNIPASSQNDVEHGDIFNKHKSGAATKARTAHDQSLQNLSSLNSGDNPFAHAYAARQKSGAA